MLSDWKVRAVEVAGSVFYQVHRTTDAAREKDRVQTRGGYYSTEAEAQALADRMNREEAKA